MKKIPLLFSAGVLACGSISAEVLAFPSFDTDAYVLVAMSHEHEPQITIGQSKQGTKNHPHFNAGFIKFDVTKLKKEGRKYLRLSVVEYKSDGMPGTQKLSETGSSHINVVALSEPFEVFESSKDKALWYDTHVQNKKVPVVASYKFKDLATVTVDVTDVVNAWIADPKSNYGLALFSTLNNVELGSMSHKDESKRPALVDSLILTNIKQK